MARIEFDAIDDEMVVRFLNAMDGTNRTTFEGELRKDQVRYALRAALDALMEPTGGMISAAGQEYETPPDLDFKAMITAAKEGK